MVELESVEIVEICENTAWDVVVDVILDKIFDVFCYWLSVVTTENFELVFLKRLKYDVLFSCIVGVEFQSFLVEE